MEYFVVIALICMALVGELAQAGRLSSNDWQLFKRQHGKSYESPAEDARRFAIFMATKQRVERHNSRGNSSFKMGLNHLADWTPDELTKLNGVKLDESTFLKSQEKLNETEAYLAEILGSSSEPVPDEFDWRTVPARVGPVKDQGKCASDWAFSAIGALEGQEMLRVFNESSQFVQLSEQQLVDCSEWNHGCDGGIMSLAFEELHLFGGIMSNKDYPYTAKAGKCAFDLKKVVMSDSGHVFFPVDETLLKQLLVQLGPISVSMDATEALQNYKSGVFTDDSCTSELSDLNHGVLLVGYGTDPVHGDYWIVKNSWGSDWGENGFLRIKLGVNMCGISRWPVYPKYG